MEVGKCYIVKEGDSWYVGKVVELIPFGVVLSNAAWIASMGCRFNQFLVNGKSDSMEIEVFPLNYGVRWDGFMEWLHPLFTESV